MHNLVIGSICTIRTISADIRRGVHRSRGQDVASASFPVQRMSGCSGRQEVYATVIHNSRNQCKLLYLYRDGRPVCLQCFHNTKSAETCVTCRTAISMDEPCIMQGRKYWHADANCFRCCVCCRNLLGRKYSLVDDSLYCGYNACAGNDGIHSQNKLY